MKNRKFTVEEILIWIDKFHPDCRKADLLYECTLHNIAFANRQHEEECFVGDLSEDLVNYDKSYCLVRKFDGKYLKIDMVVTETGSVLSISGRRWNSPAEADNSIFSQYQKVYCFYTERERNDFYKKITK